MECLILRELKNPPRLLSTDRWRCTISQSRDWQCQWNWVFNWCNSCHGDTSVIGRKTNSFSLMLWWFNLRVFQEICPSLVLREGIIHKKKMRSAMLLWGLGSGPDWYVVEVLDVQTLHYQHGSLQWWVFTKTALSDACFICTLSSVKLQFMRAGAFSAKILQFRWTHVWGHPTQFTRPPKWEWHESMAVGGGWLCLTSLLLCSDTFLKYLISQGWDVFFPMLGFKVKLFAPLWMVAWEVPP